MYRVTLALNIETWTPQSLSWGTTSTPAKSKDLEFGDRASSGRVGCGQLWVLDGHRNRAPHYLLCDSPNRDRPMGGSATSSLCHRPFLPGQAPRWWVELSRAATIPAGWTWYWPGWEPIREALEGEIRRAGWSIADVERITRATNAEHWFVGPSWEFIPRSAYEALADAGKGEVFAPPYESLLEVHRRSRETYEEDWRFLEPLFRAVLRPDDFVLEMGGTPVATVLAAEAADRRCIAIDPRPGVCELTLVRWEQTTGAKAELA